jgi:ABC-2 type transport system permease protein
MRRAPTLMVRELKTYFLSPLAYVLAALYMGIMVYLASGQLNAGPRIVAGLVWTTAFLMVFKVPILTMRLLAGEKDSGSMEILLTDPVTDWDIVLGKYLAGLLCALAMTLPLSLFALVYWIVSRMQAGGTPPDWPVVGSCFLGLFFVLGLYTAVGLLASSLTRNQIVSVVIGVVMLLALLALAALQGMLSTFPKLSEIVDALSISSRLRPFLEGQLDTRSIFYFVSLTVLVLYFTVRSVESRMWS